MSCRSGAVAQESLVAPADNSLSFVPSCSPGPALSILRQTRLHDCESRHEQPYVTIPDASVYGVGFLPDLGERPCSVKFFSISSPRRSERSIRNRVAWRQNPDSLVFAFFEGIGLYLGASVSICQARQKSAAATKEDLRKSRRVGLAWVCESSATDDCLILPSHVRALRQLHWSTQKKGRTFRSALSYDLYGCSAV